MPLGSIGETLSRTLEKSFAPLRLEVIDEAAWAAIVAAAG